MNPPSPQTRHYALCATKPFKSHQASGTRALEEMERLPPTLPGRKALLHKERSVWFEGMGDSLNDINVLASSNEESAKQLAYRTI